MKFNSIFFPHDDVVVVWGGSVENAVVYNVAEISFIRLDFIALFTTWNLSMWLFSLLLLFIVVLPARNKEGWWKKNRRREWESNSSNSFRNRFFTMWHNTVSIASWFTMFFLSLMWSPFLFSRLTYERFFSPTTMPTVWTRDCLCLCVQAIHMTFRRK